MHYSMDSCAKGHEIKHFLVALTQLGEDFGHNRDTYYSLGRHFGYTDVSLLNLESQTNPLSRILCDTAVKDFNDNIPKFLLALKQYFILYGLWENFEHYTTRNGFNSLFSILYWKLY